MKIVVFRIEANHYGLDIMRIEEVLSYSSPQSIPKMPDFIEGVIDFRKQVVPLFDMRKRFEVDQVLYTPDTRVILLRLQKQLIGLVVDEASEVIMYEADEFRVKPDQIVTIKNEFISGFVKRQNRTIVLLDIDRIITSQESILLEKFQKMVKKSGKRKGK
ncbi:purine-binding chemotaxis protein CheW [bacterium]|nr:purine-binding chemotaxis protein CheW [bacterium]